MLVSIYFVKDCRLSDSDGSVLFRMFLNAHYQAIYFIFKADFHSVESSERTGNLLFTPLRGKKSL